MPDYYFAGRQRGMHVDLFAFASSKTGIRRRRARGRKSAGGTRERKEVSNPLKDIPLDNRESRFRCEIFPTAIRRRCRVSLFILFVVDADKSLARMHESENRPFSFFSASFISRAHVCLRLPANSSFSAPAFRIPDNWQRSGRSFVFRSVLCLAV